MKRNRFSEEQIIGILKEHQAGLGAMELCRKHFLKGHDRLQSCLSRLETSDT